MRKFKPKTKKRLAKIMTAHNKTVKKTGSKKMKKPLKQALRRTMRSEHKRR